MRAILTLDDEVVARLRAEVRRTGRPFNTIVNDHLRRSLTQRDAAEGVQPFRVEPHDLGGPLPGHSYDCIAAHLD